MQDLINDKDLLINSQKELLAGLMKNIDDDVTDIKKNHELNNLRNEYDSKDDILKNLQIELRNLPQLVCDEDALITSQKECLERQTNVMNEEIENKETLAVIAEKDNEICKQSGEITRLTNITGVWYKDFEELK